MKGELKPVSDRPKYDLAVCPWCGGPADFECLENGRFSVGCNDNNGECLGFQLMTTFATKREARDAWNTRSLIPGGELEAREALKRVISAWESLPGAREYSVARAQSWISGSMKPAIDHARAILAALTPITPDGGDRMREARDELLDALQGIRDAIAGVIERRDGAIDALTLAGIRANAAIAKAHP